MKKAWKSQKNGMKNKKISLGTQVKVCHVINTDFAVKFLLLPQLKFLINEGYDIHVICSGGKLVDEIAEQGIKVKTIKIVRKISPLHDLITSFKLWNYFRKERFDIVHTHTAKPALLGQMAAKMAGVPIIINTIHGFYIHNDASYYKRKFFIFLEKFEAKFSDLIFSQNHEDVETLINEKISGRDKVRQLGNGIDIDKFNVNRFSKEFIGKKKRELNIPADFKVVGIVARLIEEKGYLDLFEAFKTVLGVFPNTILIALGRKESEKKNSVNPETAKDYGIEKNVLFLGERYDVDEIFPLMDIFTLPSYYREGLPRSILEAMAEKRPVVATDTRGCREEVENGKSGILVPVKNPGKLAEAIIFLLENPEKAKEFGVNARLRVEKEFDEKMVFEKISLAYKNLIKEKLGK